MTIVSVYAVFANAQEAERIGREVIEQRLAACINILGACRSISFSGATPIGSKTACLARASASACASGRVWRRSFQAVAEATG